MGDARKNCGWARWLVNHNPFYLLSVGLLLYGVHVSFADGVKLADGWLLMRVLSSYAVVLAAVGMLIVRFGGVWDDARTILLIIVLVLVSVSSSFDRICLDDTAIAARILAFGFLFSVALSEAVIRGVGIRLPWTLRVPYYLQLLLLYAIPVWLGHLSITGRDMQMAWSVLSFSFAASALVLLLIPAARSGPRGINRGTPWRWPLYPWALFVILSLGLALRCYSLSVSFELSPGLESGFAGYFLAPLVIAVCAVGLELALGCRSAWAARLIAVVPLVTLLTAFPGQDVNPTQLRYIEMLKEHLSTPALPVTLMLGCYSVYAVLRGVAAGRLSGVVCLTVLCMIDHQTVDWTTLAPLNPVTVAPISVGLALHSIICRRSATMVTAVIVVFAAFSFHDLLGAFWTRRMFYALHTALGLLLVVSIGYGDRLAKQMRLLATYAIPLAVVLTISLSPAIFIAVTVVELFLMALALTLVLALNWYPRSTGSSARCFAVLVNRSIVGGRVAPVLAADRRDASSRSGFRDSGIGLSGLRDRSQSGQGRLLCHVALGNHQTQSAHGKTWYERRLKVALAECFGTIPYRVRSSGLERGRRGERGRPRRLHCQARRSRTVDLRQDRRTPRCWSSHCHHRSVQRACPLG